MGPMNWRLWRHREEVGFPDPQGRADLESGLLFGLSIENRPGGGAAAGMKERLSQPLRPGSWLEVRDQG